MSGKPNRTVFDKSINRAKYLDNLALQAHINDVNLQANKVFKRTGAVSTLPDTRTTTEKLADLIRLKSELRSGLGSVLSAEDANRIVNELSNDQARFVYQRLDYIITDLRGKYKAGISFPEFDAYLKRLTDAAALGDISVDTKVILDSLPSKADFQNLAAALQASSSSSSSIPPPIGPPPIGPPPSKSGKSRNITQKMVKDAIDAVELRANDLRSKITFGISANKFNPQDTATLRGIENNIGLIFNKGVSDTIKTLMKSDTTSALNDIQNISAQLSHLEYNANPIINLQTTTTTTSKRSSSSGRPSTQDIINDIQGYYSEIDRLLQIVNIASKSGVPIDQSIIAVVNGVQNDLANKDDINDLAKELQTATNLQDSNAISQAKKKIRDLYQPIKNAYNDIVSIKTNIENLLPSGSSTSLKTSQSSASLSSGSGSTSSKLIAVELINEANTLGKISINASEFRNAVGDQLYSIARDQIVDAINDRKTTDPSFFDDPTNKTRWAELVGDWIDVIIQQTQMPSETFVKYVSSSGGSINRKRKSKLKGKGLSVDPNGGVQADPTYAQFGKFLINKNKLRDSIIMIKRPCGLFIADLQTRRVSPGLKSVFNRIVGGGIPGFDELEKLNADEREYLYFVAKKSNILDKLNLPTPNKDKTDKLVSKYEVQKGQIMAGNNNRELIKDFKKTLLEMCDEKLLPRRQVSEMLIDIERCFG